LEFEYEIPHRDAEDMIDLFCKEAIIYKDRYYVEFARKTWCLDVFGGRNSGLVVAEVELETATEMISLPDWIGEEITASLRYRNSNLAQQPFEQW
jgi:adenylate cyclase